MLPTLTLILGGAASGKSAFAENLVLSHGQTPHYIATAQAFDDEMHAKIDRHIARRGKAWTTLEAPLDLPGALRGLQTDVVLVDCATLWLSNLMLAKRDIEAARDDMLAACRDCAARIVVVSNEVGQGIVPDSALGRQFREAQGRLNIALAGQAELVVQVVAGLPNVLKGRLP